MQITIRRFGPLFLACAALVPAAAGSTIVVSSSGGGMFTDIPPAIAAAQDGDVIIVMAGTYSGFSLQKGLTIVGVGAVDATGGSGVIAISNIAANQRAIVVHVGTRRMSVSGSPGHVVVQDVVGSGPASELRSLTVDQCADVRLSNVAIHSDVTNTNFFGALTVSQSRVELARSVLQGWTPISPSSIGIDGGIGLMATSTCRAHVVLTNITGGTGSSTNSGSGGSGGSAISLAAGAEAILAGDGTQLLLGGNSGYGDASHTFPSPCFYEGSPGFGAWVDTIALLSWSGVVLAGGVSYDHYTCNQYNGAPIQGQSVHVLPDDPTLEIVGVPTAGSAVTIRLLAPAGSIARLNLGRNPIVVNDGLAPIEKLATVARSVQLGAVPPSGVRTVMWQIPPGLATGNFLVLQAEVTLSGGVLARTNSVPIVVR